MSDIKKDHSVGEGTGAVAGAVTGAVVGSAAGPAGSAVGAVVGGVVGAKAGGAVAEAVNPTEYVDHFRDQYQKADYYEAGREWRDYEPAYRHSYEAYKRYPGERFDDIEDRLEREWAETRADSRLAWAEAKDAARDGWHYIERRVPGDLDRDGR